MILDDIDELPILKLAERGYKVGVVYGPKPANQAQAYLCVV
jgi:hypothetical protein